MKYLVHILLFLGALSFILSACNGSEGGQESQSDSLDEQVLPDAQSDSLANSEQQAPKSSGKEYSAQYICPNHCTGSGNDKPGNCPECGMELIPNPNPEYSESQAQE